jgi:hypothetical protein
MSNAKKKKGCKRCGAPCWGGFVLCRKHVNEKMRALQEPSGAQLANGNSEKDEQRETLAGCDDCMAATCRVCGHTPCPACIDDCDHYDCIEWNLETDSGKKKHVCVFARCPKHADQKGSSQT